MPTSFRTLGLLATLTLAIGGCSADADNSAEADEAAVSFSDLKALMDQYDAIKVRRPFSGRDKLAAIAAVPALREVCRRPGRDDLCAELVAAEASATPAESLEHFGNVRKMVHDTVAAAAAQGKVADAWTDPAVRYWIRERVPALTAWYAITDDPQAFLDTKQLHMTVNAERVETFLRTYYPLYEPSSFKLANAMLPPQQTAATCTAAKKTLGVVIVPGVIRAENRTEFNGQIATLQGAFPCAEIRRVEFGSFDDPDRRIVPEVQKVVADMDKARGPLPLHFIGYSQGVVTELRTLAQDPAIGKRTRSVLAMNGASHGSEAADFAIEVMDKIGGCSDINIACRFLKGRALKTLVEEFFHVSLSADQGNDLLATILKEKKVGMVSLTTKYAGDFWTGKADGSHVVAAMLPQNAPDAVYYTFRSTISNVDEDPNVGNLPKSQIASFNLVWDRSGRKDSPFNDMQVRLDNHTLAGPVADREVVSRVAEGNHWQWQLTQSEVNNFMEPEMIKRMPRSALLHAYYRTLAEIGIFVDVK